MLQIKFSCFTFEGNTTARGLKPLWLKAEADKHQIQLQSQQNSEMTAELQNQQGWEKGGGKATHGSFGTRAKARGNQRQRNRALQKCM